MARLYDSEGRLLGGMSRQPSCEAFIPDASSEIALPLYAGRNPEFDPDEFVSGLECCYGSLAHSYAELPSGIQVHQCSRHAGCHNPVEAPQERHYCSACGGAYCTLHAEPAAHDCQFIVGDTPWAG